MKETLRSALRPLENKKRGPGFGGRTDQPPPAATPNPGTTIAHTAWRERGAMLLEKAELEERLQALEVTLNSGLLPERTRRW